ncbi:chromosome partitioning protein ParB [Fulvimarina endophytica]|uniref:Chromosome partitioning protein ParB n=1 Tax=Fulvimarina endophytica TaxID=2293836 RepID=A0A371WXZ2_9HYPH|nr:ParB/Srx family N-terminal domain-containing protein [Fulvimarina endophytica]RFC61832.1 chromosome partitioning protein ParB [Fulvimarina endophytica]
MKTTTIRKITLSQLAMSFKNVRTVQPSEAEDAMLEASIAAHGLEQNIGVEAAADNLFLVVYGGRRYRALASLCAKGVIDGDYKVPCRIMDEDEAIEASIAENVARVPMHPADEFDAFAKLIENGASERDVADRFGVALAHVQKRMKLARVSPRILDRYRQGEMTLEALTAFTLTPCHDKQIEVLARVEHMLNATWGDTPGTIRRMLTETSVRADGRLGSFVGVEAYEAAGGKVTRDLFSTTTTCYLDDAGLLERLAQDKLAGEATKLEGEWRWVEPMLEMSWSHAQSFARVYPDQIPAEDDPELVEELVKIEARIDELEDRADENEADVEEYETLYARKEEIDAVLGQPTYVYSADARAISGVILTLDHAGELKAECGFVRPEDLPKEETTADTETTASADPASGLDTDETADDGEGAEPPVAATPLRIVPARPVTSAHVGSDGKVDAPQTVALRQAGLSAALADDLRAIRHQTMQAHLQVDFDVSFDLVVYTMCLDAFRSFYAPKPLDMKLTAPMTHASKEHLEGTVAERMIAKCKASLNLGWMELPRPDDFKALSALHFEEKQALFCFATAFSLNQQLSVDHHANPVIEEAGRRLDVDVASCWRPTSANFFKRTTKDVMMAAARETISDAWAEEHKGQKKGQLADAMEAAFSEDGRSRAGLRKESAERTARWLPEGMSFESATATDTNADPTTSIEDIDQTEPVADVGTDEADDAADPSDDDEELPAFLTDQAA